MTRMRTIVALMVVGITLAACHPASFSDDDYASGIVNPISGNRAGTGEASSRSGER